MTNPFSTSPEELRTRDLEMSVRAHNVMMDGGIETVAQLMDRTAAELLRIDNLGRVTLKEIITVLNGLGLYPRCQGHRPKTEGVLMKKVTIKALKRGYLVEVKVPTDGSLERGKSTLEACETLDGCMERVREIFGHDESE